VATTFTVRVAALRDEARDIRSFVLQTMAGQALPPATPGAHVDVHLAPGLVRQYSLCNGPGDAGHYRIAVKREPASRGGSSRMHELRAGDLLTIGAPRNHFALAVGDGPCLLVAGGIGITPLLSMARHLRASGRPFELLYFTRGIADTAFHEELSAPGFAGRVSFHDALEPQAVRAYLRRRLWERPDGAQLYLCGPRPFMDLVEDVAAATWPPASVHLEYFAADASATAGGCGFVVRLARSGRELAVGPEQRVIEVLAAAGVAIDTSCEQGVCGTCLTGVLDGTPDHRDVFLTDAEKAAGDTFCPCVSRSHSPALVLDL
jgi:vanillate monooxygenase ferredoxin subunit